MNSTLEQHIREADGRYLTDLELRSLEGYAQSYQLRSTAYSLLCERSESLIQQVLDRLATTESTVIREHGETCRRDMTYVLRSIALAVLRDDDQGFREQLILWMQNIMMALRKEAQSARAYQYLQEIIAQQLPTDCANLINRNLQEFIQALNLGLQ
ncbi:hypothetical protein H6G89_22425 [Oscillatoria sp. FACHB-1407]|uniref:hypothetical protein n=1 Tax=Oscillatoria sp. FACHB-1407 TaxID=2692847 RepID=UPI001688A419|nr:hypothetical protein [Oscillatoria sp. FACHB-1407]MBD2463761.1 hypothetical protein [Oscillatoria sp. FACHB-1407]